METDLQIRFNDTLFLIEQHRNIVPFANELIEIIRFNNVSCTDNPKKTYMDKDWTLSLYTFRARNEQKEERAEPYVLGYDFLLPRLAKTESLKIELVSIATDKGTYIIFTNPQKTELIGILKSKRNITELKEMGYAKNIFSKGIYQNQ